MGAISVNYTQILCILLLSYACNLGVWNNSDSMRCCKCLNLLELLNFLKMIRIYGERILRTLMALMIITLALISSSIVRSFPWGLFAAYFDLYTFRPIEIGTSKFLSPHDIATVETGTPLSPND